MLSTSKKFIYIHVPKTAGTSVQTALMKYCEDANLAELGADMLGPGFDRINERHGLEKHATYSQFRKSLGYWKISSLYVFACVRNPWDRAISRYFWGTRDKMIWDRTEFLRRLQFMHPVPWYLSLKHDHFFGIDWRKRMDRIMRYETLADDFNKVCDDIGIPREKLPVRNQIQREHYSRYFDAELRDIVAKKYREEIDLFGYEFEDRS